MNTSTALALTASIVVVSCVREGPYPAPPIEPVHLTSASLYEPGSVELYRERETPESCGREQLPAVHFAFGSSAVEPTEQLELRRIARCMESVPFGDVAVVVIGRTDPVGSAADNLALGRKRAEAVKAQLVGEGVSPDRVLVTSAGEGEPTWDTWADARRVEMVLVPTRPAPPRR